MAVGSDGVLAAATAVSNAPPNCSGASAAACGAATTSVESGSLPKDGVVAEPALDSGSGLVPMSTDDTTDDASVGSVGDPPMGSGIGTAAEPGVGAELADPIPPDASPARGTPNAGDGVPVVESSSTASRVALGVDEPSGHSEVLPAGASCSLSDLLDAEQSSRARRSKSVAPGDTLGSPTIPSTNAI